MVKETNTGHGCEGALADSKSAGRGSFPRWLAAVLFTCLFVAGCCNCEKPRQPSSSVTIVLHEDSAICDCSGIGNFTINDQIIKCPFHNKSESFSSAVILGEQPFKPHKVPSE